jgi:hypothetical protein
MKERIHKRISGFFQRLLADEPWTPGRFQVVDSKTEHRLMAERTSRVHDRRVSEAYKYVAAHPEQFSPARFR